MCTHAQQGHMYPVAHMMILVDECNFPIDYSPQEATYITVGNNQTCTFKVHSTISKVIPLYVNKISHSATGSPIKV